MDTVKDQPASEAEVEKLKSELRKLRGDVGGLTDSLREVIAEKAKRGQAKAKEAVDATGDQIGQHPFASLLIALGAGFLVGFLVERKHN